MPGSTRKRKHGRRSSGSLSATAGMQPGGPPPHEPPLLGRRASPAPTSRTHRILPSKRCLRDAATLQSIGGTFGGEAAVATGDDAEVDRAGGAHAEPVDQLVQTYTFGPTQRAIDHDEDVDVAAAWRRLAERQRPVQDHAATTGPSGSGPTAARSVAQPSARVTRCRTRPCASTPRPSRCRRVPAARGRATGRRPTTRRGRGHRPSRCGGRRRRTARTRSSPAPP
jgi:hypothetical protein